MGDLELFLVYQYGEEWEPSWKVAKGAPFTKHFTTVSDEMMQQALVGWTKPLVDRLTIEPEGALRRLPKEDESCWKQDPCPFYRPQDCKPTAKKMPWCFDPAGSDDADVRVLAAEAIQLWRQGVYILVVTHAE